MAKRAPRMELGKQVEVILQLKEQLFISWLLLQRSGLNKDQTFKVAGIIEAFELEDLEGSSDKEELEKLTTFQISGYETQYLLQCLEEVWAGNKMPPERTVTARSVFENLELALLQTQKQEGE